MGGDDICVAKASSSQDMHQSYQQPLRPSACRPAFICVRVYVCVRRKSVSRFIVSQVMGCEVKLIGANRIVNVRVFVQEELWCSSVCDGVGVSYRAGFHSEAGRNRMSRCVLVEPAPQVSGGRCSFPGHWGKRGCSTQVGTVCRKNNLLCKSE